MGDKQDGQPCTRSDQCAISLRCSGGSCVPAQRDAASDAALLDEDAGSKDQVGK
jgi:hypothetical protein